ncbi:MAG TPA: nuclear transport factor 2 family protein [Arachnia sp.]|nr:nuclear transport factor 2 family protein [Arachnia sp.]
MTTEDDDRAEILANYREQLDAMTGHDTEALGQLFTDDFKLTHITGYVQPGPSGSRRWTWGGSGTTWWSLMESRGSTPPGWHRSPL